MFQFIVVLGLALVITVINTSSKHLIESHLSSTEDLLIYAQPRSYKLSAKSSRVKLYRRPYFTNSSKRMKGFLTMKLNSFKISETTKNSYETELPRLHKQDYRGVKTAYDDGIKEQYAAIWSPREEQHPARKVKRFFTSAGDGEQENKDDSKFANLVLINSTFTGHNGTVLKKYEQKALKIIKKDTNGDPFLKCISGESDKQEVLTDDRFNKHLSGEFIQEYPVYGNMKRNNVLDNKCNENINWLPNNMGEGMKYSNNNNNFNRVMTEKLSHEGDSELFEEPMKEAGSSLVNEPVPMGRESDPFYRYLGGLVDKLCRDFISINGQENGG